MKENLEKFIELGKKVLFEIRDADAKLSEVNRRITQQQEIRNKLYTEIESLKDESNSLKEKIVEDKQSMVNEIEAQKKDVTKLQMELNGKIEYYNKLSTECIKKEEGLNAERLKLKEMQDNITKLINEYNAKKEVQDSVNKLITESMKNFQK